MIALFDAKNEEGLDRLADMIGPIQAIALNKEVKKTREKKNATHLDVIQTILRHCKKELISIFAMLDGAELETYEITTREMLVKISEIMEDPLLMSFFS